VSAHVKHLVIAALVAAVVLVGVWKILAYEGNIAHDQKTIAEEKLKNDLAIAKTQAQNTAASTAAFQQQIAGLTASNNALSHDVAALRASLDQQRGKDAQMPPSELATRWNMLLGVGQIKPSADGMTADLPAAHETVSQLEEIPVLRKEKADIEANSSLKDQTLIQAQKTLLDTQTELGTCKNVILPDTTKACQKEIADLKAQARKGKFKTFIYGAATALGVFFGLRHGL